MATGMSGSLYPLAGSLPSATSGASTPPSPGSLATPVATVPLSEPIAPMLDAMEQLNVSAHDPAVGQYMATNLQAWRALQEQMRAWGVVSNNHASFLNSHVSYIANASKKLKELHLGVKDKVREIEGTVSRGFAEIQTKVVELETRFTKPTTYLDWSPRRWGSTTVRSACLGRRWSACASASRPARPPLLR